MPPLWRCISCKEGAEYVEYNKRPTRDPKLHPIAKKENAFSVFVFAATVYHLHGADIWENCKVCMKEKGKCTFRALPIGTAGCTSSLWKQ